MENRKKRSLKNPLRGYETAEYQVSLFNLQSTIYLLLNFLITRFVKIIMTKLVVLAITIGVLAYKAKTQAID